MWCVKCRQAKTEVTETRIVPNTLTVRRRRQCPSCKYRISTIEEEIKDPIPDDVTGLLNMLYMVTRKLRKLDRCKTITTPS